MVEHVLQAVDLCMRFSTGIASLAVSTVRSFRVQRHSTMRVDAKKGSKAAGKAVAKSNLPSKVCVRLQ